MTTQERAEKLAKELGVEIPEGFSLTMWPLPLLEAIVTRLNALERTLHDRTDHLA